MKKILTALIAITMAFAAAAATDVTAVDVSKLTTAQKADVLKYTASLETKDSNVSVAARVEIGKWGELGVGVGRAAVGAAKEIGVAANEFVQTPLGMVTMAVVVYKVIGQDVIGFVVGLGILITFMTIAIAFAFFVKKGAVTYEYKPALLGLYNKKYVVSYKPNSDDTFGYMVVAAVCAFVGLLVGLNVMF